MKKVLVISNSSSGLYEFRNEIILDLMKDHEVYIALPDIDHYYESFEKEGCHMLHTPFRRRGKNPFEDIKLYRQYKGILKSIRPDVACTYTIKPNIYGGIACTRTHTPYICNITGLGTAIEGGGLLSKMLILMYRTALKKADCVFFQNEHNREFMQSNRIAVNSASMLPGSGVNLECHTYQPYPADGDTVNILAVLRVMAGKGIKEFLTAVDRLGNPASNPKVLFKLAGNYEEEARKEYEPWINRLVAERKLEYLGFIDEMDPVYADCHFIVHPTYYEGLSNVCLEAAACGRPVLASDIPGCREAMIKGETGILFESQNSDALIEAVKEALTWGREKREQMGRLGREHVAANYSRDKVLKIYREKIEEITGGRNEV